MFLLTRKTKEQERFYRGSTVKAKSRISVAYRLCGFDLIDIYRQKDLTFIRKTLKIYFAA